MFYNKEKEDVIRELSSNFQYGLKPEQVEESRNKYGFNELVEPKNNHYL